MFILTIIKHAEKIRWGLALLLKSKTILLNLNFNAKKTQAETNLEIKKKSFSKLTEYYQSQQMQNVILANTSDQRSRMKT